MNTHNTKKSLKQRVDGLIAGLCEGLPSDAAGIRRRHFDIANNSLHEAIGAIDLAAAIGALDEGVASELLTLAVRLKRMLRGLTR